MHKLQFIVDADHTCKTHFDPLGGKSRCSMILGDNQDDKSVDMIDEDCATLLPWDASVLMDPNNCEDDLTTCNSYFNFLIVSR